MTHIIKCSRCHRRYRSGASDANKWNCEMRNGRIVAYLCPGCQSTEEDLEAQINEATLTYLGQGPDGRFYATPKVTSDSK